MSREVRRVPANWSHPIDPTSGRYVSLLDGDYAAEAAQWDDEAAKWAEWGVSRPIPEDYMPQWPDAERTHVMMYETTSEGTPISPGFATPEALARWLADSGASAFADQTAGYESWLRVARGGYAVSAVYTPETGLRSGVEALTEAGQDARVGSSK